MAEQDEVSKYLELRKKLVSTHSSILTTTLGKGKHLHNSYLRTLFIARVIDYLAEKAIFSKIIQIPDSIIIDAVCESSHILSYTQTQEILGCLLYEMSDGLELLDREDIGDITVENPAYCFDKTEPSTIKNILALNTLSVRKALNPIKNKSSKYWLQIYCQHELVDLCHTQHLQLLS